MTSHVIPVTNARGARSAFEARLVRLLGVAAFLCVPTAITVLRMTSPTAPVIRALCAYSPERMLHGEVWTLVGSGLLLSRLRMIGPTSFFIVALFLPYALTRGALFAGRTFLVGHVVATLAVAVVVISGALLGWHAASLVYHRVDVGASAGLAACAGALACVLYGRVRVLGALMLAGLLWYFVNGLVFGHGGGHGLTDVEHLVALAAGVVIEWRWGAPRPVEASAR